MRTSRIDLRSLILGLSMAACVVTLANSLYSAYRVERRMLIARSLEASHAYSARVASSVDEYLREAQARLTYSAGRLSDRWGDAVVLSLEAQRLQAQDRGFDSVVIVDARGRVVAGKPASLGVEGRQIESAAAAALRQRKPLVSEAYRSMADNLLIFVSVPVFQRHGEYLGFIAAAMHLQHDSSFNTLIGNHPNLNASQVYLVDDRRTLLYHPVSARIGSTVGANAAVDLALAGKDGSFRMTDSQGNDVMAGFAPIPTAQWGIVSQQPASEVLAPLEALMTRIVLETVPLAVVGFAVLWALAMLIARPLRQLAQSTDAAGLIHGADKVAGVNAWYYEASNIKQALLRGIASTQATVDGLELASQTDALTGLPNRRALDEALAAFEEGRRPLAVIALDIDHFKRVNDTFGHETGDVVLRRLAGLLRDCSRDGDLPCRAGGEEFLLLLPDTDLRSAGDVAERLRRLVEQTEIHPVGRITISLGVTTWPGGRQSLAQALKEADDRMYAAKRQGRNRVVAAAG